MPKWKNSVFEFTNYENEDKTISFETEHQYRWGHCFIRVNDDEKIEDIVGDPNDELNEFLNAHEDMDPVAAWDLVDKSLQQDEDLVNLIGEEAP